MNYFIIFMIGTLFLIGAVVGVGVLVGLPVAWVAVAGAAIMGLAILLGATKFHKQSTP